MTKKGHKCYKCEGVCRFLDLDKLVDESEWLYNDTNAKVDTWYIEWVYEYSWEKGW